MSKETIREEMRSAVDKDGQLSCESAHRIAERVGTEPLDVGKEANDAGIRITKCQLGLFGYAPSKGMPGYKLVHELDTLPEPLSKAINGAAVQGKVSCLALWRIAQQHGVSRPEMGNIVETLKTKVAPCQLGCF